ncbi:MAG: glycosyltransferase [Tannerella sp.]|jgi:glycosyltransferase involved in cell wall biosynthesis|nr:glycosyltransferase [Tannerella sp.]
MTDTPKISVITVVYNAEKSVEETICSVINQTYPSVEYIIIDGKSTDGTPDIIRKYEENIRYWESSSDRGIYDAMNKGIREASGEFICFLNSGDVFLDPEILEKIFSKEYNEDILYGDTCVQFAWKLKLVRARIASKKNEPMPFCHQSAFVRTSLMKEYRFDTNYRICADKDLFFKLHRKGARYLYLDMPVSVVAANGYSVVNRYLHLKELNRILLKNQIITPFQYSCNIMKSAITSVLIRTVKLLNPRKGK